MKWFGPSRFSVACDDAPAVSAPTEPCTWCGEPFSADDCGYFLPHLSAVDDLPRELPYHVECFMRTIVGSIGHQAKNCSCYGSCEADPPHLTRRQAAQAAVDLFRLRGGGR